MRLKLVLMTTGTKKDGSIWGKVTVKGVNANGVSRLADFWTHGDVIAAATKAGLKEDDYCNLDFALDDYLRPVVVKISPASAKVTGLV